MPAPHFEPDFSLSGLALDAVRPAAEYGRLLVDPVYRGVGAPRGDARPVLVLPGLMTGDVYLQPLRDWLRRIGYTPVASGLNRNPGWSEDIVDALAERAAAAWHDSGQRVTVVGHSLGGLQGRAVAARLPGVVRHVIALGSPLAAARQALPPDVRMTSVFSRDDRIVPYPAALESDRRGRNIEVSGSHAGLPFNAGVYRVLARALPSPDREAVARRGAEAR